MTEPQIWYVQRAGQRLGPLTRTDVIRGLQSKLIFHGDLAWRAGLEDWFPIEGMPDFSVPVITSIRKDPEKRQTFSARAYPRVTTNHRALAHNQRRIFVGRVVQIGEGGLGMELPIVDLRPGTRMQIHVCADHEDPLTDDVFGSALAAFNALAEVVSVRRIQGHADRVIAGLKFVDLRDQTRRGIQDFISIIGGEE